MVRWIVCECKQVKDTHRQEGLSANAKLLRAIVMVFQPVLVVSVDDDLGINRWLLGNLSDTRCLTSDSHLDKL